jgi:two-component system, chemotaxis family, chemotaxis protein CheY
MPKKGIPESEAGFCKDFLNLIFGAVKKQILAIDDDLSIRLLIEFILRKEYNVVIKEKALDAMLWMEKGNIPDLIIIDLEMSEIDGWSMISNIRRSGYFRSIPLIAISSYPEVDEEMMRRLKVQDHIQKPFNPKKLNEKIEKVFLDKTTLKQV